MDARNDQKTKKILFIHSFDLCKAMNEFESKSTLQMNLGFAI